MKILGVIGPVPLLIIIGVAVLIIIGLIALFSSRAKHKARAKTLDSVLKNQKPSEDNYDRLEKLNKLRQSGALSDEEYEKEKKKILN